MIIKKDDETSLIDLLNVNRANKINYLSGIMLYYWWHSQNIFITGSLFNTIRNKYSGVEIQSMYTILFSVT